MVIKKKTLYIVLPILILTILISFILIYLMGWFGNSPKLNRYESLIDNCTVEKKLFNIELKCDALVYKTEVRDSKNCLDLRVINKEQTDISELEVCEKEKVLDISDPVLDTDMKIPMHMVFKYRYLPPLSYGISNISIELIEDNTIIDILLKLQEKGINIKDVRIQESIERDDKGYYFNENDSTGTITFFESKINEIMVNEDVLTVNISIGINNGRSEYVFNTKKFMYSPAGDISEKIEVNKSNISLIDTNKLYNVNFLYIPNESILNEELLGRSCNEGNEFFFVLCNRENGLENLKLDMDIEEYVKDNYLNKLVLNYIY